MATAVLTATCIGLTRVVNTTRAQLIAMNCDTTLAYRQYLEDRPAKYCAFPRL